jgi:adenosylhomocysteine nucleosidase
MPEIAIFTALRWERRAVTAALEGVVPGPRPQTWEGRLGDGTSCVVVQAGMGLERAAAAAVDVGRVRALVSCGCAGALAPWLQPGDLVVGARGSALGDGGPLPAGGAALAAWAAGQGVRVHPGGVVSSPTVLASAAAKVAAAGAGIVVDMESAAIARAAAGRGVPFVGVRVVLDVAEQALPDGLGLVDACTGETRGPRAVAQLGMRPWLWPAVARLARQSQVAERSLRRFLAVLCRRGGLAALTLSAGAMDAPAAL